MDSTAATNPQRSASYSKLNDGNHANSRTPFIAGRSSLARWKCVFVAVVVVCCIAVIGLGIGFGVSKIGQKRPMMFNKASGNSFLKFGSAAVVSQSTACNKVGRDVMLDGGTAVDAAIATMVCEGAYSPQSCGLGGGFFMIVYSNSSKKVEVIDAREMAPIRATADMYDSDHDAQTDGGLAVAVPGELRGYQLAHERHGRLNWTKLFEPTVRLCREGIEVSKYLENILMNDRVKKRVFSEPSLSLFINNKTGDLYKAGERIVMEELANTLSIVAENGAEEAYRGKVAERLLQDIHSFGGILTQKDLESYQPVVREAVSVTLNDSLTLYSVPPPGSGLFLGFLLKILDGFKLNASSVEDQVLTNHLFVEACKFAYAKRPEVADPDFSDMKNLTNLLTSPEFVEQVRKAIDASQTFDANHYMSLYDVHPDHGTAHVSVLAPNGDAVSVTSTLNLLFGAGIRSMSTGIILNNEMDDFSIPNVGNFYGILPSEANYVAPRKRPASSMTPSIVVDDAGTVRYVLGSSGGVKIISTTAYAFMLHHWLGEDLGSSVSSPRLHHQLNPNVVEHDSDFPPEILADLRKKGHRMQPINWLSANNMIYLDVDDGAVYAAADPRRPNVPAGF